MQTAVSVTLYYMGGLVDGWMGWLMDRWRDGMDEWTDGWMDGWMD